jgi:hypothetical protein
MFRTRGVSKVCARGRKRVRKGRREMKGTLAIMGGESVDCGIETRREER